MRIESVTLDHERARNFVVERPMGAGVWVFLALKARAVFCIKRSFLLQILRLPHFGCFAFNRIGGAVFLRS